MMPNVRPRLTHSLMASRPGICMRGNASSKSGKETSKGSTSARKATSMRRACTSWARMSTAHTWIRMSWALLLQSRCRPSSRLSVKKASSISHRRAYKRAISRIDNWCGSVTLVT